MEITHPGTCIAHPGKCIVMWGGCVSEFTLQLLGGIDSVKINTPPPWKKEWAINVLELHRQFINRPVKQYTQKLSGQQCYPATQDFRLWMTTCKTKRKTKAAPLTEWLYTGKGEAEDEAWSQTIYFVSIWEIYLHVKFSNWDIINTVQLQFRRQRRDETKHRVDHEMQHIPDNAFFSVITFCASQCTAELRELNSQF